MGIFSKAFKTAVVGIPASAAAWTFWTRDSKFVPFDPEDDILKTSFFGKYNPQKNPATQDFCIKKVPVSKIQPELLKQEGKLAEAFCAGVWGGLGIWLRELCWKARLTWFTQATRTSATISQRNTKAQVHLISSGHDPNYSPASTMSALK